MICVCTFRSYRYSSYQQFIRWVFDRLGKKNRRVIPSCVLWKIRNIFPEENGYTSIMKMGRKTNEHVNENEICSKIPGEKKQNYRKQGGGH